MIDIDLINQCEKELKEKFSYHEEIALFNQEKSLIWIKPSIPSGNFTNAPKGVIFFTIPFS